MSRIIALQITIQSSYDNIFLSSGMVDSLAKETVGIIIIWKAQGMPH